MNTQIVNHLLGLSMGQVYAYLGMLLAGATFFAGGIIGDYFKIAPDQVDRAFYSGGVLWVVGTTMYIWRSSIENGERRSEPRREVRASMLSNELARTLPPDGMTLQEVSDVLEPHPHDSGKTKAQLLKTTTRGRIREAAADGTECYENDGRYFCRNDHTIIDT